MDNKYRIYLSVVTEKEIYLSVENIKEHTKYDISNKKIFIFSLINISNFIKNENYYNYRSIWFRQVLSK